MSNNTDWFLIIPSMPGRERPERQWKSPLPQDRANLQVPPPWSPVSFLYTRVLRPDSFPLVLRDSPRGLEREASTLTCSLPCIKQNYELQLFLRPCGFFQRLGNSALLNVLFIIENDECHYVWGPNLKWTFWGKCFILQQIFICTLCEYS